MKKRALTAKAVALTLSWMLLFGMYPVYANRNINDDVEDLLFMEINVGSTKAETVLNSVSTVSVIDQKAIQNYNFKTISEAVAIVAGFDSIRTTFMNTIPMARGILQPLYANKILILINNIPTWFSTTGEGFLNRVDINDVERIEVLKGPASVVYGSNAYSGAVNIVLKKQIKYESHLQIHGSAGNNKSFMSGGNYSYGKEDSSLFVGANAYTEDGHKVTYMDKSGRSGDIMDVRYPKGGNLTWHGQYKSNSLLFNGFKDEFTDLEGSDPLFASGAGKPHPRSGYLASYSFNEDINSKLHFDGAATFDWNEREFSRDEYDTLRTKTSGYRANSNAKANLKLSDNFNIDAGAEYEYRWVDYYMTYYTSTSVISNFSNIDARHSYEYSGFCQLNLSKNDFRFTAGSRYTKNEFFGNNTSSRGTLVYSVSEKSSVKLIVGQSFRAPSIFEMFVLTPSRKTSGTLDLKPETSDSIELAYLMSAGNIFVQLLGYQANYYDKIARVPTTVTYSDGVTITGVSKYTNVSSFKGRGIELEMNYRNPELIDGFLNASAVASDDGQDINFKFVPDYNIVCGLSKEINRFFFSGVVKQRGNVDGRLAPIDAFTTGDINFGITADNGNVRHTISVKNVADTKVLYPEYVWQSGVLTSIPSEEGRMIEYTFTAKF